MADLGYNSKNISNAPNEESEDINSTEASDEMETSPKAKRARRDPLEVVAEAFASLMSQINFPPPPQVEEIKLFCTVVEKKLRKLSEERANVAMMNIYQLLFQAELSNP